jgi:DNA-binding transcriptional regulator GbsR (MarR family)
MEAGVTNRMEDVFIELGGKLCTLIGWRRIIGQVYMLLYISDRPLSLDDIVKRVDMSKSTVWAVIKKLQRLCAVNITENQEGKKGYYTAERDLNVIFKNGIIPELSSKLLFVSSYLKQVKEMLADFQQSGGIKEEVDKYNEFIEEINEQKARFNSLLSNLTSLLSLSNSELTETKNG